MEIVIIILVIGLILLTSWVHRIQARLESHRKLSELAESVLWNTLLEQGVISEEVYQDALDRFRRNIPSTLSSDNKKRAQIEALRGLLEDEKSEKK